MDTPLDAGHGKYSMLLGWHEGLRILVLSHFATAKHYTLANDVLGGAVIITTAVVGSAIFTNIGKSPQFSLQILAGVISLTATLLAALQKYLGYDSLANKNHEAADKYSAIRMEVQVLLAKIEDGGMVDDDTVNSILKRWTELQNMAPMIPARIYEREKIAVTQEKTHIPINAHAAKE